MEAGHASLWTAAADANETASTGAQSCMPKIKSIAETPSRDSLGIGRGASLALYLLLIAHVSLLINLTASGRAGTGYTGRGKNLARLRSKGVAPILSASNGAATGYPVHLPGGCLGSGEQGHRKVQNQTEQIVQSGRWLALGV